MPTIVTLDIRDEGKDQYVYLVDVFENKKKTNRTGPNLEQSSKDSHQYTPPFDNIIVEKDGRILAIRERNAELRKKQKGK